MERNKITILLIQYPDPMATFMTRWTRFRYTHATIGLGEDLNTFYSFVHKGFIVEKVTRYLKPDRDPFPCALYEITVPPSIYRRIKKMLLAYAARKQQLRYTQLGLVLALMLRIPYKRRDHYFCSQFVAEVLQRGRAAHLPRKSMLYFPKDFHKLKETNLVFTGNLQTMAEHYQLLGSN